MKPIEASVKGKNEGTVYFNLYGDMETIKHLNRNSKLVIWLG